VRVENFDDRTEISVAAPGVSSESFTVDLNSNTLTVGYTAGDEDDTHFAKNTFTRSWRVQDGTEADDITAAHNNGVLTVTVAVPESTSTTTSIPVN
jgi:HSP20 family molecular chaperone IbpA